MAMAMGRWLLQAAWELLQWLAEEDNGPDLLS